MLANDDPDSKNVMLSAQAILDAEKRQATRHGFGKETVGSARRGSYRFR
jgi:hypothetical protein